MIDTKKEQEREELHRAIWAIADELRGAVDGWDFKNYVLGTMFYRYISENLCSYINSGEIEAGNQDFDYAVMPDEEAEEAREDLVQSKGFFILPSELFANVCARAVQDENLNETLERVFRHIEESAKGSSSESSFAGLFDDYDVNSNKLGSTVAKRNEKLVKLLNGVAAMNLGNVKDHEIDAFGDAYEYLMTMYASNAGKSGGEFFTPADVSELLTRLGTVGKTEVNKVYDPACGSGSLLLKAEKILGKDAIRNGFFGQEINITTYNLCRINMFLHDVGFDKFDIACEDTLTAPQHWDDEPFELIVSNPPYSIKWAGDENPLLINDPRCIKVTNNNKLIQANIGKIVEVFAARAEEPHFSHLASYDEIEGNAYNLSVSTYVEAEDTREKINIVKLNAEIEEIVAREQILRDEIAKIIAEIEV